MRVKADLLAQRGSDAPSAIIDLLRESMSLAHKQHALYWELSAAISLAEIMQTEHMDAEAKAVLIPVYDRLTEGFSALRVERARALLM